MPRGDKSSYSDKQKRMAEHIEDSVRERGGSEKQAERIGWATVNKYSGSGRKSKSGSSSKKSSKSSSKSSKSRRSSKRGQQRRGGHNRKRNRR